jgi:lipopolysaccharide/colanic/teichoic acid biosynthesis glycosyltransferase
MVGPVLKQMLMSKIQISPGRQGIFHSLRFHLLFSLAAGVLIPALLVQAYTGDHLLKPGPAFNSMIVAMGSAVFGLLILRRLSFYPTTSMVKFILPATAILYGIGVLAMLALRLTHSNLLLALSFVLTLASFYALATLKLRRFQATYYVVPGGRSGLVDELEDLVRVRMTEPRLPVLSNAAFIADLHHDHCPEWQRMLAEAAISGCPVYHYKQVWEAETGKVQIEHLSENSFGALIPVLGYRKVKRAIDVAASIALLPILLIPGLVVALAIKFDSPGPVFFRQWRMGFRGEAFRVCKFRTMIDAGPDEDIDSCRTMHNDKRITRLGRFLRRTRIDEVPQIWNVLCGEMSWIGPRPEELRLSQLYEREIPFYRYRHIVRPGITGWAQVNQGHVTELSDIDHKLQFDFYYIKNISYWIDLLIFFRTLRVMLDGFGAK